MITPYPRFPVNAFAAPGGFVFLTKMLARVAAIGLVLAFAAQQPSGAQAPPQRSVFQLVVMAPTSSASYRSVERGTGFFISTDGTALTASHVVYAVRTNPAHRLMAIMGKEFYGATLICASDLPYDPTKTTRSVPRSFDVAEIRITPPDALGFTELTYKGVSYASAHSGPLPAFPALTMAEPQAGETVRVLGFGAVEQPVPYEWSATGTVSRTLQLVDGTPAFEVAFPNQPTVSGHSGSPVLNTADQVVGLWDWHAHGNAKIGTAISSSALRSPCSHQKPQSIQTTSLGLIRVIRAVLTHAVASGAPTDEPAEFKSGERIYAYVVIWLQRPLTAAQLAMRPAIVWRWTAPSGEVLTHTQLSDFLKEGQTQIFFWSPLPSFEGKVQKPVGTWNVECLLQDLSVARMTLTMVQ